MFDITFEEMDARQLRYDDGSFDEVHLHYVLDDPSVSFTEGVKILAEAKRVIRPTRPIVITGEIFRYDGRKQCVERVEDKVKEIMGMTGFEWPKNQDDLEGLQKYSSVSELVRRLYHNGIMAGNDRNGFQNGIYLLVFR